MTERETSIRRGVEVLLALATDEAAAEGGLGVTRVAANLGRKTQVSRTLATLAEYGLVERDPETRAYRVGWRVYAMAQVAGSRRMLDAAAPLLEGLVARFGEGAHLSVLQGADVLTVLSQQSPHAVQAVNWIGRTTPAHCTSAGKALLLDRSAGELAGSLRGPGSRGLHARRRAHPGPAGRGAGRSAGARLRDRRQELDVGLTAGGRAGARRRRPGRGRDQRLGADVPGAAAAGRAGAGGGGSGRRALGGAGGISGEMI